VPSLPTPKVPVAWGELLDKITILAIKRARIADARALANVEREYRLLEAIAQPALASEAAAALFRELKGVNEALWDIEDAIRIEEAAHRFGDDFVALARSVYRRNDQRAALKREINRCLGSRLVEEKSYAAFAAQEESAPPAMAVPALG
jgi:hypothetical protein